MSTGSPTPLKPDSLISPSLQKMLLVWVALMLVAWYFYPFPTQKAGNSTSAHSTSSQTAAQPSSPLAAGPSQGMSSPVAVAPPRPTPEEIATAKIRWIEVQGRIEGLRKQVEAASRDTDAWTALIKELPHNEAGRRIAGSPAHVDKYRVLLRKPRRDASIVASWNAMLKAQADMAQEYLGKQENIALPGSTVTQELDRLSTEVRVLAEEYQQDRPALEALVADTATLVPAKQTLEKAVEERDGRVASEYLSKLADEKKLAEDEIQQKIREAETTAIRQKGEAEADRIKRLGVEEARRLTAETEQRLKALKEEAAHKQRQEEMARLRKLAEDPAVQRQYSAYLAKGHVQFDSSPGGALFERSPRPLPASYGQLDANGWLRNVESFAKGMSKQPNSNYPVYNDRPTRAFPRTSAEWTDMEKLLEQFKALAPIWIEMGLLRP